LEPIHGKVSYVIGSSYTNYSNELWYGRKFPTRNNEIRGLLVSKYTIARTATGMDGTLPH
jgi:hypothetical protein